MQAIKTRVKIPINHHLSFNCYVPESVPSGTTDVMIIFETVRIPETQQRILGQFAGRIKIADDFDAPLTDQFWLGEGK